MLDYLCRDNEEGRSIVTVLIWFHLEYQSSAIALDDTKQNVTTQVRQSRILSLVHTQLHIKVLIYISVWFMIMKLSRVESMS